MHWHLLLILSFLSFSSKASLSTKPPSTIESDDDSDGFRDSDASEDTKIDHYDFERDEKVFDSHIRALPADLAFGAPRFKLALKRLALKHARNEIIKAQESIHSLKQLIQQKRAEIKATKARLRKNNQLPLKKFR